MNKLHRIYVYFLGFMTFVFFCGLVGVIAWRIYLYAFDVGPPHHFHVDALGKRVGEPFDIFHWGDISTIGAALSLFVVWAGWFYHEGRTK